MGHINNEIKPLVNYELKTSNSNNYHIFNGSSSPESFPCLMENGILVEYEQLDYASDLLDIKEEIE